MTEARCSPDANETVVLRGLCLLAWLGVLLTIAVLVVNSRAIERRWVANAVLAGAVLGSAALTVVVSRTPQHATSRRATAAAVVFGVMAGAADGWAFEARDAFQPPLLAFTTVLAGVMLVGFSHRWLAGAISGLAVGVARWIGSYAPSSDPPFGGFFERDYPRLAPLLSITALYMTAGVTAAFLRARLAQAIDEVAAVRAREALAVRLHDGVLQTLAIVARRTDDPRLAQLVRQQDHELRDWIAGRATAASDGIATQLRTIARHAEERFGIRTDAVVAPDLAAIPPHIADALVGAAQEAVTNAGKHSAASHVVVYLTPDDEGGLCCTVHDDGRGFDRASATDRLGIRSSIVGRVTAAGGCVDLDSVPGRGTEVVIRFPSTAVACNDNGEP